MIFKPIAGRKHDECDVLYCMCWVAVFREKYAFCRDHGIKFDAEVLAASQPTPVPSSRVTPLEQDGRNYPHYTVTGPIEPIHVIEQFRVGFNLSCVIKYILRADHKGQRDSDLEKAINYLWRERYGTWRPSKD